MNWLGRRKGDGKGGRYRRWAWILLAKFRELRLRGSGVIVGELRTREEVPRCIAESYELFFL